VKIKVTPRSQEDIVTISNYLAVGTKAERQLQIIREAREFNRWSITNNPELLDEMFDYEIIED